jgi:VCBS repeat-containing protein
VLGVTGTGFLRYMGATNDIDVSKLSLSGEGGDSRTLTSSGVEITSNTAFNVSLNAADRAALGLFFNKDLTISTGGATYNLAAAEDWARGADATVVVADLTGNGVTVNNVAVPTITSTTFDTLTGVLVVTGTGFSHKTGPTNDIVVGALTLSGGSTPYTLTSPNVEITSNTSFSVTLNSTDRAALVTRIDKDGLSASGAQTYNLAAAEDWAAGADTAVTVADLTLNPITASGNNVAPVITSNAGGTTATLSVPENSTAVTTVTATDGNNDTVTFSITGGTDAAKFTINPTSGTLALSAAPNFEAPTDSNANNSYVVNVTASDGKGGTDVQTLTITVTNANDAPVITSAATGTDADAERR